MKLSKATLFSLMLVTLMALVPATGEETPGLRTNMLVTTQWLADHLHDQDLVVLCISSSADSFAKGHIPGARNILLSQIAVTRNGVPNELPSTEQLQSVFEAAGMSNHSLVVLYGDHSGMFAARAYFTLDYLGVADRVSVLDGGLEKWKTEQRPVSTESPKPTAGGKLRTALRKGILVDTAAMRSMVQKKNGTVAILDGRPAAEYSGAQTSEDVPKAGHIPNSQSLFWMNLIVSRENPVLKPEAELRRMYAVANAHAGQPVVTYCRTGMQASFDYFVAKYLGYDPGMYDASFYEWSREDLPVEVTAKP
ncbi:MAG: sulfurtransferase [Acidobacteriia bacterium]|nr:sulfurtransferase [Terriglobia bacterium]